MTDVDPDLESMMVPKLIVQPLVENAVSHGIARKTEGGTVWISGHRTKDGMVLQVENDGQGMDELEQESLRQILNTPGFREKNIGLKNVYERIRLYYGNRADLKWESTPMLTRFTLSIHTGEEDRDEGTHS